MVLKVNGKEIKTEIAYYAYAFNDAIDPTGLGSIGVYFEIDDLQVYIGIKNDVIDFITNKNLSFFINLEDDVLKKSELLTNDSKFGDGHLHKVYINEIMIEIDTALFRYMVYHKKSKLYASQYSNIVAKEKDSLGALLKIETPFELGTDGLFIGYICLQNRELLVLDKAIINEDILVDDVRYNIWRIKQNIVNHYLSRSKNSQVFEPAKSYQNNGYADYFNGIVEVLNDTSISKEDTYFSNEEKSFYREYYDVLLKEKKEKKEMKEMKDSGSSHLGTIKPVRVENKEEDVFVSNNTVIAPGFINGQNMTNFGVKEARKGYFELEKGKTWLNVGYRDGEYTHGDNFYTCNNPSILIENLSKIEIPFKTTINFGKDILSKINKGFSSEVTIEFWKTLPKTKAEAEKLIKDKIKNNKEIKPFIKELVLPKVNVTLSLAYLDYVNRTKPGIGTVFFVTHPFYYTIFSTVLDQNNIEYFVNNVYTSPISNHKFGLSDKLYYKNFTKEYRSDNYIELKDGYKIFKDVSWFGLQEYKLPESMLISSINSSKISYIESNFGLIGNTYCVDLQELKNNMGLNASVNENYPFGEQNIFVNKEKETK